MRKRTDANQAEIKRGLEQLGYLVADTSQVGRGFPDMVCLRRRELLMVEVKQPKTGRLTPAQRTFSAAGWPVVVISSLADLERL